MFQSVSGHSSVANHSSRPTVLQLKCVSDTISNWFENRQPKKTNISTVTNSPFIKNSNQMASSVDRNHKFSEGIFSTPVIFKATSKLFDSQGCSDDKNWLDFASIFFSQFNSAFAVSFHSRRSVSDCERLQSVLRASARRSHWREGGREGWGRFCFACPVPACLALVLARRKFKLTNQDSAGGKKFTVLTSMKVDRKAGEGLGWQLRFLRKLQTD